MTDYMILSSGEGREEQRLNFGLNEVPLPETERFVSEANGPIRILLRDPRDTEGGRPEEVTVNLSPDMIPRLYELRVNLYYEEHFRNLPALGAFLKEVGLPYANCFPSYIPKYKGEEKAVREAVARRHAEERIRIPEELRPFVKIEVDAEGLAAELFDAEMAPFKVVRGSDEMLYLFDMKRVREVYSWVERDKTSENQNHIHSHGCRMR